MRAYELRMTTKQTPKQAIERSGMTLREIAAAAGCDISTVWRSGKSGQWPRRPSVRRALLKALGLEVTK